MTDDLDLYTSSDEVQEIMNYVPHWIVRGGITIVFITILMLLGVSWLIKYPDTIKARVKVMSQTPPIKVVARSTGKLTLYVKDHDAVTPGTTLAVIENPANIDDIFVLKKKMEEFKSFLKNPESITNIVFDRTASLGQLQDTYAEFIKDINSLILVIQHENDDENTEDISPTYGDEISKLVYQKVLLFKEVKLAEKKYSGGKILFDKGLLSEMELADIEVDYKKKLDTMAYVNGDIRYIKNNLSLSIQLTYKRLESQLSEWNYKYVLTAPIKGDVSFFDFWSNNQFINAGDDVMTIVPPSHNIIGKVYLPIAGSGKVKKGQKVYIQCDNYPCREYGFVKGEVASISLMPQNDQFLVTVDLPEGLNTTFNKNLDFKQEMDGIARIVTMDLRLIQRFFNEFRYLFSSSF